MLKNLRPVIAAGVSAVLSLSALPALAAPVSAGGVQADSVLVPTKMQPALEADNPELIPTTDPVGVCAPLNTGQSKWYATAKLPSDVTIMGVTWADGRAPEGGQMLYRVKQNGLWSQWFDVEELVEENGYADEAVSREGSEPTYVIDADQVEVCVGLDSEADTARMQGGQAASLTLIDGNHPSELTVTAFQAATREGEASQRSDAGSDRADGVSEGTSVSDDVDHTSAWDVADAVSEDAKASIAHRALVAQDDQAAGTAAAEESRTQGFAVDSDDKAIGAEDDRATSVPDAGAFPYTLETPKASYESEIRAMTRSVQPQAMTRAASASVNIKPRSAWGANESWMKWTPRLGTIRGAVVHHTAGTNNYTRSQVPSIIRGIYYYHAVTLGWGDIGYNVLVDKFGQAWQGRAGDLTKPVIGAHAYGLNSQTFGISVMGTYEQAPPPPAAIETVSRAIAWKFSIAKVPAFGTFTVKNNNFKPGAGAYLTGNIIDGHRAWNPTSCPGTEFYAKLPAIRKRVSELISPISIARLAGSDRIGTSIAISRAQFPQGAQKAYLVRNDALVDSLVAGTLTDGPILLTTGDKLSASVRAEIARLKPTTVVAIGGKGVLPDAVLNAAPAKQRMRLGGETRFDTAIAVSRYQFPAGSPYVYVADAYDPDGNGAPDAVAGGALTDGPILLAQPKVGATSSTIAEIARLEGTVVELGLQPLGVGTQRVGGKDRYMTATAIANRAFPKGADTVYLAEGSQFVDAVAGGSLTAGPIVLVQRHRVTAPACQYLRRVSPSNVVALGGTGAVSFQTLAAAQFCAASGR